MKPQYLAKCELIGMSQVMFLSLLDLYSPSACEAQVQQVLDMRNPGPRVARIIPDWGPGSKRTPQVIGDVDGDRFDDFAIVQADPTGQLPSPHTIIIYGSPNFPSVPRMADLRQTRLVHGDGFLGISAWSSPFPCAPAGDLDRDGYADFFLGSASTDWQGKVDTGLVLLIFGAPNFPGI